MVAGSEALPNGEDGRKDSVLLKGTKSAIAFIKEWGGVGTILIALLYTFPFEAFDRFYSWRDRDLVETRKILSETAALMGEATIRADAIRDAAIKDFVLNTYKIRVYNMLANGKVRFENVADRLIASELYFIGSALYLNGLAEDAIPFLNKALEKARAEDPRSVGTILRELGRALFPKSPVQNIEKARKSYLEALAFFSEKREQFPFGTYMLELSVNELMDGDWDCGQKLYRDGQGILQAFVRIDPNVGPLLQYYAELVQRLTPKVGQMDGACPYTTPQF